LRIIGIGTDIVDISRISRALTREKFLSVCFTQAEIEHCQKKGAASFAGLFAAKESVAKALGTGFVGFFPRDIEICHDVDGKPMVKLSDKICCGTKSTILVSISHEKAYATAFAVVSGE